MAFSSTRHVFFAQRNFFFYYPPLSRFSLSILDETFFLFSANLFYCFVFVRIRNVSFTIINVHMYIYMNTKITS